MLGSEATPKTRLFANLKKWHFHQDEVCFLGFVVSTQKINIEELRIEAVKAWLKPKLIRDIQMFLGFVNFYQRSIQRFSRIAAPLTSMLKTTAGIPFRAAKNSNFLISETKLAFLRLKKTFTEAAILHHFDLKRYIRNEIDVSGYDIGGILSYLTLESGQ